MTRKGTASQQAEEDPTDATENTQRINGGHHEPSYTETRSRLSSERQEGGSESLPRPTSHEEVEKPGPHKDDDASSNCSSESGRISRLPRRPGSEHGLRTTRSISVIRDGIESRHDAELGEPLEKEPTPHHLAQDENLVTWDVDDPENPKIWSFGRKWAAVTIVSIFTFISPVSSSMIAPALDTIGAELNITTEFEKSMSLSIFVLGEFPMKKQLHWL